MTDILQNSNTLIEPSFNLKNRACRFVWNVFYILFFRTSPVPLHAFRSWLLRLFGAQIGSKCHIYPKATIWAPWNLSMGNFSSFANGVYCYNMDRISIGDRTVVSQGVKLITGTHDYTNMKFPLRTKEIVIGSDVWIASDSFVCPGVVISDGVVVGARSVVTKNVAAWTVCAGNPAKFIKKRILNA